MAIEQIPALKLVDTEERSPWSLVSLVSIFIESSCRVCRPKFPAVTASLVAATLQENLV